MAVITIERGRIRRVLIQLHQQLTDFRRLKLLLSTQGLLPGRNATFDKPLSELDHRYHVFQQSLETLEDDRSAVSVDIEILEIGRAMIDATKELQEMLKWLGGQESGRDEASA